MEQLNFKILKEIGSGGYATAYLIEKENTQQLSVLKIQREPGVAISTWVREYEILQTLKHPNIVQAYSGDISVHQQSWIELEYCANGDLITVLERTGGFPEQIAHALFLELLGAIEFLHCQKIAHRDLKPDNVLISEDFTVKLGDFGCAMSSQAPCALKNETTKPYWAPEMWICDTYDGNAADLFALGAILHIMVRGVPFRTARYGVDANYTAFCNRAETTEPSSELDDLL